MRVARIKPLGRLDATLHPPGSKSLTNRALIAAALAEGESELRNASVSDDSKILVDALNRCGARVQATGQTIRVAHGRDVRDRGTFFCGNAGTALRFLTAFLATGSGRFIIDGDRRMRQRPVQGLVDALNALGADGRCIRANGCPPISLEARGLRGGRVEIPADVSSQFVSAVLLAAPQAERDVEIVLCGRTTSASYIEMTIGVMRAFGVQAKGLVVRAGHRYAGTAYEVEPDASGANYFCAMAAVTGGRVVIEGLGTQSAQGERSFVKVLERMGCRVEESVDRTVVQGAPLHGVTVDMNDAPDSVQTLAVVALFAEGPTSIRNVANLRVKETDRLAAAATELRKMGATVEESADGLKIAPSRSVTAARIASYDDHRMVMSFAVAAARVEGMELESPDCVAKSFPEFWDTLRSIGASISFSDR